jgi:hypothetical protein
VSDLLDQLIGAAVDARLAGDADLEHTLAAAAGEIVRLREIVERFTDRVEDFDRALADIQARLDGSPRSATPRKQWN